MTSNSLLIHKIEHARVKSDLRDVLLMIAAEIEASREQAVNKTDFNELKEIVRDLAVAQQRTEQRVEELAVAQQRTEQRVGELASAQQRTEQRVGELATAQQRTEQRVEELAIAQQHMERSLSNQISALGSRWGIYNEGTFRATIYGILKTMPGISVQEGFYGNRQVDIVIRNGEHVLLEITSRMHAHDIDRLYRSADDYEQREGVQPKLMVATSYVSPGLMQKIMGLARPIEIFSYEGEE